MSKARVIISSLIIFLLLSGVYLYLNHSQKKSSTEQEIITPNADIIHINEEHIIGISFSSAENSGIIKRVKGKWIVPDKEFQLDQRGMELLINELTSIVPIDTIACKEKELGQYGLLKPISIVNFIMINNEEKEVFLGDEILTGDGYYIKLKDDPRVYVVEADTGEALNIKLKDLKDKSIPYISTETINYIKIVQNNIPVIELKANKNRTNDEIAFGLNGWMLTKPYKGIYSVDLGRTDDMISGIKNMKLLGFEEDTDNLKKYGLDKPHTDVLLRDEKNNILHLSFGKHKDINTVYLKISNRKGIYCIGSEYEKLFRIAPIDIIQRFAFIASIYDVNKVIIKEHDDENVLEIITAVDKKNDAGISVNYKLNGKLLSATSGKAFYQNLIGLIFDAEVEAKNADANSKITKKEPEVSTIFFMNKGMKRKIIVNYNSYNSEFYTVFRDGKNDFLISKHQIGNILNELRKLK